MKHTTHHKHTAPRITLTAIIMTLAVAAGARAAVPPVKLVPTNHFGREVNLTEKNAKAGPALEDVCSVQSKDECQPGTPSSTAGGFEYPESVASAPNGNVYIADKGNGRVQELTATGEFVLMFGREVNATTKGDICTAASKDACKAGIKGPAPGQLDEPQDAAVDPASGDVYIAEQVIGAGDAFGERVQEFTGEGVFVLEIGKEVNEKTKGNLCTEKEVQENQGVQCIGPAQATLGVSEHGAFNLDQGMGDLLAVGGEHDTLYVGEEDRVQELNAATGVWTGEIPLTSISSDPLSYVSALAVDSTGNVYLVYGIGSTSYGAGESTNVIREFNPKNEGIKTIEASPRGKGATAVFTRRLAIDSEGHLAVGVREDGAGETKEFGDLYNASTGRLITEFTFPPRGVNSFGFSATGELYAASENAQDVLVYGPEFVAELVTGSAPCVQGVEHGSSVTFDCVLGGEVNPEGVSGTEAWFDWGRSEPFTGQTAKQPVLTGGALVGVQAVLEGLRPDETFSYQLVGEDGNVKAPESLTGEKLSFRTPVIAPRVVSGVGASFVRTASVVMSGELNPENASTAYEFQYAKACTEGTVCPTIEQAPGMRETEALHSSVYGKIGATLEATGLEPGTTYRYQLHASNEQVVGGNTVGGQVTGPEATFTTAPAPLPAAETGAASAVAATTAMVSGAVNPDGLPATYAFELGVYEGASTQYGIVLSGAAGAGSSPVPESLALSGLQPGSTYAYRITVSSGYINNASHTLTGAPMTFTTTGVASVLTQPAVLAQLPVPSTAFPAAATSQPRTKTPKCAKGKQLSHGKCIKARKKRVAKAKKMSRARKAKR
ncbi:MAG TPA: NHL repeat-containing protein [Solirubrobacteraceae bacterium]|jgi:hypothetical protein